MTTIIRIQMLVAGLALIGYFPSDGISQDADTDAGERHSLVRVDGMTLKTETFDRDPGWLGVNNRSATQRDPITIRQDFGYSAATSNAAFRGRLEALSRQQAKLRFMVSRSVQSHSSSR